MWHDFAHNHFKIEVLARLYERSEKWVRYTLDAYTPPVWQPAPRRCAVIMDATHVGSSVLVVVRDVWAGENIWMREYAMEDGHAYQTAYAELTAAGFEIVGITGDGRVAVPFLFPGVAIQMCHFHQIQIVIGCTTLNPLLPAAQEILALVRTLPTTDKDSFTDAFNLWCRTWYDFLNERTVHPTGKKSWTHKKLRRARTSIKVHLPFLFTYQDRPGMNMENTTNSLDGTFAKVKTSRRVHTGLTHERQVKLLSELLRK